MATTDRNIPHVCNIFGGEDAVTEMRIYECSPGSRRRRAKPGVEATLADFDFLDREIVADQQRTSKSSQRRVSADRGDEHATAKQNGVDAEGGPSGGKSYSTKTLTDRDIRHLERHLSMKKTIRKQISRNLAQAFVEDPKLLEADPADRTVPRPQEKPAAKAGAPTTLTLTRAKMSRSDQNILQLLKEPQPLSEDIANTSGDRSRTRGGHPHRPPSSGEENRGSATPSDGMFSSFWKMFSSRSRGKR